jgi:hypothetical protein
VEVLVEAVLVLVDFFNVPSLVVVAPAHMSWRKTDHLLSLKLLYVSAPHFFVDHLVIALLQKRARVLVLLDLPLVVVVGSFLIPLEDALLFIHLLFPLKPLGVGFLIDLTPRDFAKLSFLLVLNIFSNYILVGPLLQIASHVVFFLFFAVPFKLLLHLLDLDGLV